MVHTMPLNKSSEALCLALDLRGGCRVCSEILGWLRDEWLQCLSHQEDQFVH
jgi:hypothetical protein